ncbi:MAG TPA: HAD family hydrolase [Blastocatellia bacterium]|nr:HAD family hydrolase [Blastocatellia bacterium]
MIKGVIFDIDGTLVDSVDLHAQAWQEAFRHFGHEISFQDIRRQIGKGGDQLMPVFLSEDELKSFGKDLEEFRGELFKKNYLPQVKAFPRVRELFERILSDNRKIVLASSAKGDELAAYKRIAQIEDLINDETSSDDVARSKPHPDIFQEALEKVGRDVSHDEVIVIGDTPYDAQAAGKLEISTIGVLCGGFPEIELRGAGCIAIFRDPADLLERYEQTPLAVRPLHKVGSGGST